MHIGVDFGTTHTSAAFYDHNGLKFIPLDLHNPDPHILRSMIYIDREQRHCLGLEAVETFLAQDTGRPVVFERKMVGTIDYTVAQQSRTPGEPDGPITVVQDVVIDEDVGASGRLLQSIKSGLRFASYTGTDVFGKYYSIQELIALILTHVRRSAEQALQRDIDAVVLGRPVTFNHDPSEDRAAEQRLRQAAELAGFAHITFMAEPIAAAHFYLAQATHPKTILVFDFGGGTLDLTVMRAADQQAYDVLATEGVLIGGDDLDSALMRDCVAPYFGIRSKIDISFDDRGVYFDDKVVQQLNRWQTIPLLSRERPLGQIERAKRYGEDPQAFAQLACLVTKNYGFPLFERIEQAKRMLSTDLQTAVSMHLDEINLDVPIRRSEFNLAIGYEVGEIRSAIRQVIKAAGVAVADIDVVVTTGGSSAIPIFQTLLKNELPASQIVQSDLFGSVTGGLAIGTNALQHG